MQKFTYALIFLISFFKLTAQGNIYELGDTGPAGGIIFYDKGDWTDDWRYLEVWTSDESDRNYGCHFGHATTDTIGGGYSNSEPMSDSCNDYNKSFYMIAHGDKRGWHIPNKDESDELYNFKSIYSNIDLNLSNDWYWTSSDKKDEYAYARQIHYGTGSTRVEGMQYSHSVRLIRQVTVDDVQERTNKSLHLDGNTFYTISNTAIYQAINANYYRSIGFWVYPKESGDIMAMYENHNSTDSDFLIRYNGTDNKIEFIGDGTSANGNYTASFGDLPENQWYHVYMVINNGSADYDDYSGDDIGTLYAWVNGVRQTFSENNSNKIGVSISNNTSYLPIYVGGFENAVSSFEGYIDDLAIWGQIGTNRGLSTSEVNSIYSYPPIENQNRLNTGFDFNSNDSTTINDISYFDYNLVASQSFTLNSEVPYSYDYKPLNLGFDYSDFVYNEFIQVTQDLGDSFLVGSINVFDPNSDSSEITLSLDETYGDVDDFNMVGNNLYFNDSPPAVAYSIKVVATDAQSNSFEKILQINVTEPTNYAPVATAQSDVAADEQAVVTITLAGTDADSDPLTYIISTLPTNGTLSDNGTTVTADDLPKTLSSADVAYVSSSDSATEDSFTFKVNDGTVDSEAATVSLAIAAVNDAPVATAQTDVAATEQTEVTITLAGTDPDLTTPVIFKIISLPSDGTLSDDGTAITADDLPLTLTNASGEVTYTSTSDSATEDSFTFKVNDGTVDSEAATVSLAIAAVNDAPVATAQTDVAATEQTEVTITLAGTDPDETTPVIFKIISLPSDGTLSDDGTLITSDDLPLTLTNASGEVTYTSTSDSATEDSFTFKVNDGTVDSEAATVSLAIAAVNDAPVATAQTDVAATEQTEVTITLAGTDPDLTTPVIFKIISLPSDGTLSDDGTLITSDDLPLTLTNASGEVTYTSTSDSATEDSFTFKVNDGTVDSEAATVSLAIAAVNDVPVATAQTDVAATEQTEVTITLAGTDPDETTPVIFKIISLPSDGTLSDDGTAITADDLPLTLTNASGEVTYTSTSDSATEDSFTFKVNDGELDSTTAYIDILIEAVFDDPIAESSTFEVIEQVSSGLTLGGSNPDDDGGEELVFIITSLPENGTLFENDNTYEIKDEDLPHTISDYANDIWYKSTSDTATSDSFTFKVNVDGNDSEAATVSLVIAAVNDAPVATAQTDVAATEQTEVTITLAGTDPDETTPVIFKIISLPSDGTLSDDGTLITSDDLPLTLTNASGEVTYTSTSDSATEDSFTFKVNDGTVDSEAATVSLAIAAVNDAPVATAQTDVAATEQTEVTITLAGTDPDETTPVIFKIISLPSDGTLSDDGTLITSDDLPLTLTNASGEVTYTSTSDSATEDSFTFKVNDGTVDSEAATVSLAIAAVNDAPVATAQTDVAATEQTEVTITLAGTDADSDPLTYIISTLPTNGTLSDNGTTVTADDLPKTLSSADVAYVSSSDSATEDSFTFKVNDGTVDSEAATVSLAIAAVNDAPVATAQTDVAATEQTEVTITLVGTDAESDAITYIVSTLPTNGTLSDDGTLITSDDLPKTTTSADLVYVSTSDTATSDTFTFKVNDGTVDSEAATVSIAITTVNDVPVATAQTDVVATEQTEVTITLAGTDFENDTLSYIISTLPSNGTLSENGILFSSDELPIRIETDTINITNNLVITNVELGPYTYVSASFGPALSSNPIIASLILADDGNDLGDSSDGVSGSKYDACQTITNGSVINGQIALIERGDCSFYDKVRKAQEVGAIAVVVINRDDGSQQNWSEGAFEMGGSGNADDISIPSVMLSYTDGIELKEKLLDNIDIHVSLSSLTTTSADVVYISTSDTVTSDSFTFKVNDGTVDSETATVSLAITAVNDAPVAIAQTDVAATEQTEVTITLAGTDPDETTPVIFKIISLPSDGTLSDDGTLITSDDLPLTLTNASGEVTYTSTSDSATEDSFTFKVNDGTVDSEAATVSLAITAVNDEPTKVNLSSLTIDENASATEIGTLSSDDLDTNDAFTYELVSGEGDTDNSLFNIDTDKLKNIDAFDFETKSSYSVRIKSTDSGSASIEGVFAITVNNINDISISSEITSTYCDGSDGTGVITIVTSETNGEVSYNWTGPNGFTSTDQNLTGLESGTYELTVKDDSFEKSIELIVEKTEIFNELSVCYVTTDSDDFTKNRIFLSYQDIYNDKKYEILREGSEAGVYEKIGEIDSGETSFLDTSSNNSSSSYSYKVRLIDNCDVVSSESSGHRTILLQSSLAVDNSVNLNWNSYEGVNYSTYKIYRRVNNGDFEELTAISSTNNSYNDTGADVTQNAYAYYVSIAVESCTTTQKTGAKETLSNNFRYSSRVNEVTEIKSNQKFIQDDNGDYDNDGVLNAVDSCLDTPEGSIVDVTGCAIFTLPLDNNKVSVISASCIGNTDGSIGLSVEDDSYNYTVTVTGQDDPIVLGGETKTASVTGLGTGTYTVCFTVEGQDGYEQCFEVNIGEPKALSAFIDVDNDNKTTSIQLSGSSSYNVEVNGERYDVKGDRFTANLPSGLSIIKISTDLDCQGIIEREVFISEDIHYYPNPTQTDVNVHVSGEDNLVQVSVFSEKGDLIYSREQQIQDFSRKTNIDLSRQITGTYIVVMDGPTVRKTFKIVKR